MGNTKGTENKEYDIKINHPRFQHSKVVTLQGQRYLETNFTINQKEYDKWKVLVAKVQKTPQNLFLPVKNLFKKEAMCGHSGTAVVDYHNYPYLLTEQIYDRRGKKSRFSEVEIWFLLYSLIRANGQACQINQQIVDLRPTNIFLNEDGKIRVSTNLSWPLQVPNTQKAFDKEPTYIAPEDFQRIARGQFIDGSSEVGLAFSMGLTALSAGNLTDYENLYDMKNHYFDKNRFEEDLMNWKRNGNYSEVLRGTVSLLCSLYPSTRMTVPELNDLLLKHHESIEDKNNFVVDNAPPKLHEQILMNRQMTGTSSEVVHQSPPVPLPPQFSQLVQRQESPVRQTTTVVEHRPPSINFSRAPSQSVQVYNKSESPVRQGSTIINGRPL